MISSDVIKSVASAECHKHNARKGLLYYYSFMCDQKCPQLCCFYSQ